MPTARNKGEVVVASDGTLDWADVLGMIKNGERLHLVETEQDNERVAQEILERTLGATTADDLFDEGTTKVDEVKNQPLYVTAVKFRNADETIESGLGIYAIVFARTPTGSTLTITTGADKVVTKLIKALQLSALPRWLKFASDTTAAGYTVYDLVGTKRPASVAAGIDEF